MISVKYTILLVALVFGSVPVWTAPVGTRTVSVKAMRRIPMEKEHMRRAHHSATSSVVKRNPASVANPVARAPVPQITPPPHQVGNHHHGHHHSSNSTSSSASSSTSSSSTSTASPVATGTEQKRRLRRHHAKNVERGSTPLPRELPRFKRDVMKRDLKVEERHADAQDANIAREKEVPREIKPAPTPTATPTTVVKKAEDVEQRYEHSSFSTSHSPTPTPTAQLSPIGKREPEPAPEPQPIPAPVRPIVMFRRALAFEDLD